MEAAPPAPPPVLATSFIHDFSSRRAAQFSVTDLMHPLKLISLSVFWHS